MSEDYTTAQQHLRSCFGLLSILSKHVQNGHVLSYCNFLQQIRARERRRARERLGGDENESESSEEEDDDDDDDDDEDDLSESDSDSEEEPGTVQCAPS